MKWLTDRKSLESKHLHQKGQDSRQLTFVAIAKLRRGSPSQISLYFSDSCPIQSQQLLQTLISVGRDPTHRHTDQSPDRPLKYENPRLVQHSRRISMRITILNCCLLLLLAGCARIPEPVGYQYTTQPKMQAAYHWVVLASDVANRINNQLILSDYPRTPVYVRPTCGDEDKPCSAQETSTFTEAFRDLLITELVRFGVPVRKDPDDESLTVHYKVQLVYHHARRVRTIQPGVLTSIAAGVMVLRNAPHELKTIAGVGLLDFMNASSVNSSAHEVIITTSMIAKDKYLFRTSDLYYINDEDTGQYREAGSHETAEIPLVSPKKPAMAVTAKKQETVKPETIQPLPFSEEEVVIPDL